PHKALASNLHWVDGGLPASLPALRSQVRVLGLLSFESGLDSLLPWYCELNEECSFCLGGPHHYVRSGRRGGDFAGELELPAKVYSHVPLLVGGKELWCCFWPGASTSSALPDKVDVVFRWWETSSAFPSAPFQQLSFQHRQDVPEACVGSVTEWADFLVSEPLVEVPRTGKRVIR